MSEEKYALIELGGKQHRVSAGKIILIPGSHESVTIDKVLMLSDGGDNCEIGAPYVSGAKIAAKILGTKKGKKEIAFKKKRRKGYKKKTGHRQMMTEIQIESVA